ncbi:MAG: protein-L-isoaspartate(D-aspartate) O-methyltransferase [Proteobacteria bacterium]|nr:protein-L-isoaspartate(D-aspartate) O-methyltransferase [Pseudomonadota bacterium]
MNGGIKITSPTPEQLIGVLYADGISDIRVLDVMQRLSRAMFIPDAFRHRAYENAALPIGHHQTISQPTVVARMTEALRLDDRIKVLEIGTGSGYQTSELAMLCRRVYTVERHKPLLTLAEERFKALAFTNIVTRLGDGSMGWREQAPFGRIMVTAAAIDVPGVLLDQLDEGGIMLVPVGLDERNQHLIRVVKSASGIETEDLGPTRFVPLISSEEEVAPARGLGQP